METPKERVRRILPVTLISWLAGLAIVLIANSSTTPEILKTPLQLVGSYTLVTVTVALFYSAFVRRREEEMRKEELRDLLNEKLDAVVDAALKYGLLGFVPEMDFVGLFKSLEPGDELWWLDTFDPAHAKWRASMANAVARGATVNMLIQKPHCENANHRAREITARGTGASYEPAPFNADLEAFLAHMQRYAASSNGKLEPGGSLNITEYQDLPGMPIYVVVRGGVPAIAYSSFFLTAATGESFPHMKWGPGQSSMLDILYNFVKEKWDRNQRPNQPLRLADTDDTAAHGVP